MFTEFNASIGKCLWGTMYKYNNIGGGISQEVKPSLFIYYFWTGGIIIAIACGAYKPAQLRSLLDHELLITATACTKLIIMGVTVHFNYKPGTRIL